MYSRIDWFLFLRFVCSNSGCHFYNFYHKSPEHELSGVIAHYHYQNHYLAPAHCTSYHAGEPIWMVETSKYMLYQSTTVSVPSPKLGPSLPQASVYPSPEPKEGRMHSPAGERVGESQFGRLEQKSSTLSTLWLRPKNMLLKEEEANLQVVFQNCYETKK
jgi:hypothetical protein